MLRSLLVGKLSVLCLLGCGAEPEPEVARAEGAAPAPAAPGGAPVCEVVEAGRALPEEVRETSGLIRSLRDPGLFWTHNDAGNDPVLFALSEAGEVVGRVRVTGAELQDWEDLAAGPCPAGDCLYVSDTGDNGQDREFVTIYQIPEPSPEMTETAAATALHARFPEGRLDAEALFVLPSGDLYLVTKGRHGPIALYRYPASSRGGETVMLERVKELGPEPEDEDRRVTGATASPDGEWVGIRTYRTLNLYRTDELLGPGAAQPVAVDLSPLGESQGESLAIGSDGTIWLTSEAENEDDLPRWSRLSCEFPAPTR